jgi:regulator of replication initiation timing
MNTETLTTFLALVNSGIELSKEQHDDIVNTFKSLKAENARLTAENNSLRAQLSASNDESNESLSLTVLDVKIDTLKALQLNGTFADVVLRLEKEIALLVEDREILTNKNIQITPMVSLKELDEEIAYLKQLREGSESSFDVALYQDEELELLNKLRKKISQSTSTIG